MGAADHAPSWLHSMGDSLSACLLHPTMRHIRGHRSVFYLRLTARIIACLLAITLAMAPFAMPKAMAHEGHRAAAASVVIEEHDLHSAHTHMGVQTASSCSTAVQACEGTHGAQPEDAQGCCGIGLCHAFQISTSAPLGSPLGARAVRFLLLDEQVEASTSGGLDRPPRTV